jgi:hypothetical protein
MASTKDGVKPPEQKEASAFFNQEFMNECKLTAKRGVVVAVGLAPVLAIVAIYVIVTRRD